MTSTPPLDREQFGSAHIYAKSAKSQISDLCGLLDVWTQRQPLLLTPKQYDYAQTLLLHVNSLCDAAAAHLAAAQGEPNEFDPPPAPAAPRPCPRDKAAAAPAD